MTESNSENIMLNTIGSPSIAKALASRIDISKMWWCLTTLCSLKAALRSASVPLLIFHSRSTTSKDIKPTLRPDMQPPKSISDRQARE
eukprot:CAMPEP_0204913268 /NCGR_PEP_ID=MMETSP1397-20131031/11208_1 /ASSEMBLY_ACC=CAM_ASM_000891 /TAXON_ID=49980 /ORGANISM="Climacostomum Climacostomum virens, Strain Stock W-24" /LENGTH=87 /DNA_ID=CAMNT_0052084469 /DNA_START=753 /DNA_END=1016 /DNA_ORIENTATION=+